MEAIRVLVPDGRLDIDSHGDTLPRREALSASGLSRRDRMILGAVRAALVNVSRARFPEVLAALGAAVERAIPAGRIYLLGYHQCGPIVGSLVSNVGIAEESHTIVVVRVRADAGVDVLGRLLA
jgi:hypothetical protein